MTLPDGRFSRFSQIYLRTGVLHRDDVRMRERLYAILPELAADDVAIQLRSELGLDPPAGYNGVIWGRFYRNGELKDILDSITLVCNVLRAKYPYRLSEYQKNVARIFLEQNVGYRIDEKGIVHFAVDEEFERGRRSTIAALDRPRYLAVSEVLKKAFVALDATPPDGKPAVRSTFSALEALFRLMFPTAPRLGGAEIEQYLRPAIAKVYRPSSADLRAAGKFVGSFKEWVEAAHFYRHEEGKEEPAQSPLDLAVAIISTGTGLLRWLAELDRQLSKIT